MAILAGEKRVGVQSPGVIRIELTAVSSFDPFGMTAVASANPVKGIHDIAALGLGIFRGLGGGQGGSWVHLR
jgi:hypothetical protein